MLYEVITNILREHRFKTPLLIFRNDGDSARVAKTVALKTYSSGPRGVITSYSIHYTKLYELAKWC